MVIFESQMKEKQKEFNADIFKMPAPENKNLNFI